METNQIVVSNGTQHQVGHHRQATEVASLCKEIVTKTAQNIQGRRYVRVEGWQSVANAFGCVASAKDVERTETGFRAIGQVRKMDTGAVIAEAEGFVGDDERTWSKRDEYAKRAMAQTRAISRACRSAFAFVVTMMDAGLETTPAEEVPHGGFEDAPRPSPLRWQPITKQTPKATDDEVIDVVAEPVKAAPARKKQPVAAMEDGADWDTATFLGMETKTGNGKKGPWTCFKATIEKDGRKFYPSTFDEEHGAILQECKEGEDILVQLSAREYVDRNGETKKGYDLKAVSRKDVPSKAEAEADELADDDIPF